MPFGRRAAAVSLGKALSGPPLVCSGEGESEKARMGERGPVSKNTGLRRNVLHSNKVIGQREAEDFSTCGRGHPPPEGL